MFYGPWSVWATFLTPVLATIDAPVPLNPANGTTVSGLRPILEIANGPVTGNTGTVMIEFQIATDPGFGNIVETLTRQQGTHATLVSTIATIIGSRLPEQRTSVQPSADLEYETTYYWRARGTDETALPAVVPGGPAGVVSGYSVVWSFTTPLQGTTGGLNLSQVTWLHTNVSGWPVTSTITSTSIGNPPICINHTKSGAWPSVQAGGTIVEGNPWVFANVGGQWYAATYKWIRPGQTCKQISASNIGGHIKQNPLTGWSPKSGEQIGLMVSTPARFGPQGPVNERSNVVLTTWP